VTTIDADNATAPNPVELLLGTLAACAATDVVDILAKRRTPVEALVVDAAGDRVTTHPRRYTDIRLTFRMKGRGIERAQAERAIDLAVEKYCSVRSSLREDIKVTWTLELE